MQKQNLHASSLERRPQADLDFHHAVPEHHALTGPLVWYKEEGLGLKEKRSGGWCNNTRAHSIEDLKQTLTYITQYAEHHALVLLGRVPGFKRDDVKLLPSSETKAKVYSVYSATMKDSGMNAK